MIVSTRQPGQRGITLIEILVALLIFSFGLIGIAGLLVMATGANHGAYLRTQVEYLAQNMADRMSANPVGVWNGKYNEASYPITGTQSCASGCTSAELAAHDQQLWSSQLNAFLPNAKASINCGNTTAFVPNAAQLTSRPPYGGSCAMTISWSDRGSGAENDRKASTRTFAWDFQP